MKLFAVKASAISIVMSLPLIGHAQSRAVLEEVVVTAQKREESLQDIPIAVAALSKSQLMKFGIDDLGGLVDGAIPSLKVQPNFDGSSTLVLSMRGVGSADVGQITKDLGVGVYVDGVYLGRAQGPALGLTDLERIEALRGPQGTLYGRNSLGGAVNLISAKPTGEFGIEQLFSVGSYDYFRSLTHVNLPQMGDISAKLSYLYSEDDGWVDNKFPGAENFGMSGTEGGRLALRWAPSDDFLVDYSLEKSHVKSTMNYFQFSGIPELAPGFTLFDPSLIESPAREKSRIGVPLEPTRTRVEAHTLIAQYSLTDQLELKSITGIRNLENDLFANYGGVLGSGRNTQDDLEADQWSQEFQLVGSSDRLQYVAGLYWYEEKAKMDRMAYATLVFDPPFGTGSSMPISAGPELAVLDAGTRARAETESRAAFGQLTWTPAAAVFNDRLDVTIGLRYTDDRKEGKRPWYLGNLDGSRFKFDTDRVDPMVSLNWRWTEDLSTYVRWATGYRAGGANLSSADLAAYDEEELESLEIGLKSEWFAGRMRVNGAVFETTYKDKQMDFPNPMNPSETATVNASNGDVKISGLELSIEAVLGRLSASLHYDYLDGEIRPQMSPFAGGNYVNFELQATPRHSGSVELSYEFPRLRFGDLTATVTYTGSDDYYQNPQNFVHNDGWDLVNARLTLSSIPLGDIPGKLEVTLWGRNILDEAHIVQGMATAISHAAVYNQPRTIGVDILYQY